MEMIISWSTTNCGLRWLESEAGMKMMRVYATGITSSDGNRKGEMLMQNC